jgi:hypothetical protein
MNTVNKKNLDKTLSNAIILSASLYGSFYLFSVSMKGFLSMKEKYNNCFTSSGLINLSVMCISGTLILVTGIEAIQQLNKK